MTASSQTVVLGFGVTGQSVARYLTAHGANPIVLDSRAQQSVDPDWSQLQVHWGVEKWPSRMLRETERVIVSPGLPPHHPLVREAHDAGLLLQSDIDLFMSVVDQPVIGVTGTNGKSTVVTLVGHLLRTAGITCSVGGNLGVPALDLLNEESEITVLELSSFQLAHSCELRLASAALLNISDDHRDWHGDFDSYQQAKMRIYVNAKYSVGAAGSQLPMDAYISSAGSSASHWKVASFEGAPWIYHGEAPLLAVSELPISGAHNVENCLWALALVQPWIAPQQAAGLLKGFLGLPHRFATVAGPDGVCCINDSKATNVGATLAALEGFEPDMRLILIAGGDSKDADLTPLGEAMHGRVKLLLTLGKDSRRLNRIATDYDIAWREVQDMDHAVASALEVAAQGDTVLLSPACASLDMYANFMARGEHFSQLLAQHTASVVKEPQG